MTTAESRLRREGDSPEESRGRGALARALRIIQVERFIVGRITVHPDGILANISPPYLYGGADDKPGKGDADGRIAGSGEVGGIYFKGVSGVGWPHLAGGFGEGQAH